MNRPAASAETRRNFCTAHLSRYFGNYAILFDRARVRKLQGLLKLNNCRSRSLSSSGFGISRLLHLFAGEIKLRCGQQQEHENREKVALGQAAHNLRAKLEKAWTENVIAELLVLQQSDHDTQQPKYAAACDQTAGVKRAGTDVASLSGSPAAFHQPTHHPAGKNSHGRGN